MAFQLLAPAAQAQAPGPLPTKGREFWLGFMQNAYGAQELRVVIAAQFATSGTVSMPLTGWTTPFTVSANGTATVLVPTTAEHLGSETVNNRSVLVQALDSVTVTALNFQSFTYDGAQVLPTTALGTQYRVEAFRGLPGFSEFYKSELLIVATADNSSIEITPSVATSGGRPAGVPFTVNLNAGETYQVQGAVSANDLTGTLVEGTNNNGPCRPFAVFGGSMCANVPVACPACDHLFEQMAPVEAWGYSYHTVKPAPATSYTCRITAHQNSTDVSLNGSFLVSLSAGQSHVINGMTGSSCISGTNRISVVQIMEGYNCTGAGDPAMIVLIPDGRHTTAVSWRAMGSNQVNNHRALVVMASSATGTLFLNGVAVSPALFTSYPSCAGMSRAVIPVGSGTNTLSSTAGFIAYAVGLGTGESYAFPLCSQAPPPPPPEPIICSSGPLTLTSPVTLMNPWWDVQSAPGNVVNTGSAFTFTPTTNDVYTVHGELPGSGCPYSYSWPVGVPVDPTMSLAANGSPGTTICMHSPVQLSAVPPPNPAWYQLAWSPANLLNDPAIPDPIAYPTQDTWFKLSVTSPVGCGSFLDSVLVHVSPNTIHSVEAVLNDSAICVGGTVQLQARVQRIVAADRFDLGSGSMWTSIQGGAPSTACGAVTGQALYFNGGAPRSARTVPLNVSTGGKVHFSLKIANGTAPCEDADPGDNVILEYSTNGGGAWNAMATYLENAYPTFTAITANIPVAAQTATTIFRWSQPVFTAAAHDNWAIDQVVITSFDGTGLNYAWSPAAGLGNPAVATTNTSPGSSATYTVSVTDPTGGCTFSDDVSLLVEPALLLTLTADTTNCGPGSPVPLSAAPNSGSGITYAWTPNNGTLSAINVPDPVATPTTTTTYQVTATSNIGCTATGSTTITVGQLTGLTVSSNVPTLCAGGSAQLSAVPAGTGTFSYAWVPPAFVTAPTAAVTQAQTAGTTTFTCTATDVSSGCTVIDSVTVYVNGPYSATSTADTNACTVMGMQLDVQHNLAAPFTIAWSPAANLNQPGIANPTIIQDVSATYTVTVTDAAGCSASSTTAITLAFPNLTSLVTASACQGQNILLDAGYPGNQYAWSTGATSQQITVSASGTYTVTITDAQGCQAVIDHLVTVHPQPVVNLGPDLDICGSTPQVLDANNPGYSVMWSTGATTQQITVTNSGTYSVTATSPNGCQAGDAVDVQFLPLPTDNLVDITACTSSPVVLDAGNTGATYTWSTGATTSTITPSASGTYTVTVTTPQNCSATFDAVVNLLPPVDVVLPLDTTICQGTVLVLDAGAGPLYTWSTGATTQTITIAQSGTYWAEVGNGACTATDTIQVILAPAPVNNLADVTQCEDMPIVFDAGNPGSTYLWNTGATTPSLIALTAGPYSVTITSAVGCTSTYSALATYVSYPVVELGPDTVLCQGEVLHLYAGPDGTTYQWNNGITTSTIGVTGTGHYQVLVGNGYCTSEDAIQVIFNPLPARMAAHQLFTCLDEDPHYVLLDAGNPGSQFDWNTGAHTQTILAVAYGWYYVEVTNAYDCAARDSVVVVEYCPATVYVPNSFTPNGDGVNDVWLPVGKSLASIELEVFDRWGHVVFSSADPDRGWDGTVNGEPVPNDVYIWRMSYRFLEDSNGTVGHERRSQGHVSVLR